MSEYNDSIHPKVIYFLYCFHIYFTLNVSLALLAAAIRATFRMELEQQFNELHLTTSLQGRGGASIASSHVGGLLSLRVAARGDNQLHPRDQAAPSPNLGHQRVLPPSRHVPGGRAGGGK
ncbi:hypothetical protein CRG98_010394 [Punica granatum]|uniref:Uncharacterized protein n=1 Tax=Punica granatum TaxID=22663 RepID=A0A2I0KL58_PUNGR|nr:hypothetical protein CRG98_010394 [Punica granatum]